MDVEALNVGAVSLPVAAAQRDPGPLDALGLGDEVRARGAASGGGGVRDHRGRWLLRGAGGPGDLLVVHRADLLRVLLDAVPAEALRPGERVRDFRLDGGRALVDGPVPGQSRRVVARVTGQLDGEAGTGQSARSQVARRPVGRGG